MAQGGVAFIWCRSSAFPQVDHSFWAESAKIGRKEVYDFLDPADSTAIAEALGPLRFTAFKNLQQERHVVAFGEHVVDLLVGEVYFKRGHRDLPGCRCMGTIPTWGTEWWLFYFRLRSTQSPRLNQRC